MTSDHYLKAFEQKMGHDKKNGTQGSNYKGEKTWKKIWLCWKMCKMLRRSGKKTLETLKVKVEGTTKKVNEFCGLPNALNNTMYYMQQSKLSNRWMYIKLQSAE